MVTCLIKLGVGNTAPEGKRTEGREWISRATCWASAGKSTGTSPSATIGGPPTTTSPKQKSSTATAKLLRSSRKEIIRTWHARPSPDWSPRSAWSSAGNCARNLSSKAAISPAATRTTRDQRFEDPDYLARVMGRVHREQPHLLENLLNRGSDGLMSGMMGDGMTGGEGASRGDSMADNLVVKATMADVVATGVKRAVQ